MSGETQILQANDKAYTPQHPHSTLHLRHTHITPHHPLHYTAPTPHRPYTTPFQLYTRSTPCTITLQNNNASTLHLHHTTPPPALHRTHTTPHPHHTTPCTTSHPHHTAPTPHRNHTTHLRPFERVVRVPNAEQKTLTLTLV